MEDSRNDYDSVQTMDEGYIGEAGSILIVRALIFLLEAPISYLLSQERVYLSSQDINHRLPLLSSQEEGSNQVISHPRGGLNQVISSQERFKSGYLSSQEMFKPGYLSIGKKFKSLLSSLSGEKVYLSSQEKKFKPGYLYSISGKVYLSSQEKSPNLSE